MAVKINKEGNLVITLDRESSSCPSDALKIRREAIYDAITEHNRADFIGSEDVYFGLVELLRDTEPSEEQYQKMFNNPH